MNTGETHAVQRPSIEAVLGGIATGSVTEGIGAIATIALAIVGLAGVFVNEMAAIATIVIGCVILMEGGMVSVASRRLASVSSEKHMLGGGVTAEFFGGLAGIILGILAFFRPDPLPLLSVAVLVFGAAVLLGGGAISRLSWLLQSQAQSPAESASSSAFAYGTGGHTLIGLGAVVLGILAVIGLVPTVLVLVGLLSLGAGAIFSGSTAGGFAA